MCYVLRSLCAKGRSGIEQGQLHIRIQRCGLKLRIAIFFEKLAVNTEPEVAAMRERLNRAVEDLRTIAQYLSFVVKAK